MRRHRRVLAGSIAALGVLAVACAPMPQPPTPTNGSDLTIRVQGGRAEQGTEATYQATVSSVGDTDSTGPVTATVVVPPGQSVSAATGAGWNCDIVPASATCTNPTTVAAGSSLPAIVVTASVGGPVLAASVYGAVAVAGDVNPANDTARGTSTVVPPFGSDQLYIQLGGSLNLRSGGNVSTGQVAITSDLLGPATLEIDATVGTTQVTASLSRRAATLFSGPVTITDPALQGGTPLEVNWRGDLRGFGSQPFRNLSGSQPGLRIPSLDLPGISGAALNGVEFSLGITAGDYEPNTPNPAGQPPLTYAAPNAVWAPTLDVPDRIVNGATFTMGVNLIASSGAATGPVSADIDVPAGLEFVGAASGTTCTPVPAVPGRQRCSLNASVANPVASNIVGRILGAFLPTGFPSIGVQLRPTVDFTDLTIGVGVDSANSVVARTSATVNPRPPGPDVGLVMNGPERTQSLWFAEGVGVAQNRYQFAVDNVGTASSANNGLTVTAELPDGVTYRGFTTSGLTNANRFTCAAAGQQVTCTRPNGIPVTGLLSPAPTFEILVDVAAPVSPSVTATATVVNTNDVDPSSPAKSAAATTRIAAAGAPQFAVSLSTGAFAATDRPVLAGGFDYSVAPNGRLDGISGCATSRDFQPAILLVPIVGPTLVPDQFSDNTLCINATRIPATNQWVGTARVDFVAGPVFIPGIPLDFPVLQPRPVSAPAGTIAAPTLNPDGTLSGTATGANPELVLNGGVTYQVQWNLGQVPGVTCVDSALCP
jgi:hypothetical protein